MSSARDPEDDAPSIGELRRHRLTHLPVLRVDPSMQNARFARACDSNRCTSVCCGTGVYADRAERDRILEHAEAIVRVMDPGQPPDPRAWFDEEELEDADFPSGVGIGTQAGPRGCVFLNQAGRCVLQKAHIEGAVSVVLKPFYCFAFPVTIHEGTLMIDDDNVEGTRTCCQPVTGGERSAMDVFAWELDHVLGPEGVSELRAVLGDEA
ncbi:MAG TPA: DUF3109 family protein [Polyangiaceae bacterium]|nr:DUF3109 family protein [Polyangiaceae bacterium]